MRSLFPEQFAFAIGGYFSFGNRGCTFSNDFTGQFGISYPFGSSRYYSSLSFILSDNNSSLR